MRPYSLGLILLSRYQVHQSSSWLVACQACRSSMASNKVYYLWPRMAWKCLVFSLLRWRSFSRWWTTGPYPPRWRHLPGTCFHTSWSCSTALGFVAAALSQTMAKSCGSRTSTVWGFHQSKCWLGWSILSAGLTRSSRFESSGLKAAAIAEVELTRLPGWSSPHLAAFFDKEQQTVELYLLTMRIWFPSAL